MKILMLSSDAHILDSHSEVHARLLGYRSVCGYIDVIVGTQSSRVFMSSPQGDIRAVFGFKPLRALRMYILSRKFTKERTYEYITTQNPVELGLIGLLISHLSGIKLQVQVHTEILSEGYKTFSWYHRIQSMIALFVMKHADAIRVVSKGIKNSLIEAGIPEYKIHVVPIVVNKIEAENIPLSKSVWNAVYVGRLEKEKNPMMALSWFCQLQSNKGKGHLYIIGTGTLLTQLRNFVKSSHLQNSVSFLGHIPHAHVLGYIKQSSVLLCSSRYEGYGMALIEAAMYERPVISTDVGVARDIGAMIVTSQELPHHVLLDQWNKTKVPKDSVYTNMASYYKAWSNTFI